MRKADKSGRTLNVCGPSSTSPSFDLTPTERDLVRAFRQVNDVCQRMTVALLEKSMQNPTLRREKHKAALCLINGGA